MPFENLASEISDFVRQYVDSFAGWDLLVYFNENPESSFHLSQIAQEIGRKARSIESDIAFLVERGLVERSAGEPGGEPVYRLSAPPDIRKLLEEFLEATRDRIIRLSAVGMVLKKEARRK